MCMRIHKLKIWWKTKYLMPRRVKKICVLLTVAPVVNRIPDELSQRFGSFSEEG